MKEHHKHPPLVRPSIGHYNRCEWAIYGTTCGNIEALYEGIKTALGTEVVSDYIDADHSDTPPPSGSRAGKKSRIASAPLSWNEYDDKLQSWAADVTFINGNHYPATRQIVVIDAAKKDSLHRRVDQLTHIDVVLTDGEIFDFVKEKMTADTKVFPKDDIDALLQHLRQEIKASTPPLKAVILAGGKSKRMGTDKSTLNYHGQDQQIYMAELCKGLGLDTYISKGSTCTDESIEGFSVIKDRLVDMGPFGAILSCMMHDPNSAWLVLACDLPYVTTETVKQLVDQRNTGKYSTAYKIEGNPFPEPLAAIYEPRSYRRLLSFLSLGYACPRKMLINTDIATIGIAGNDLNNVNTPEEREATLKHLSNE